jgi:ATP-binding cassette subfamily C protein
MNESIKSDSTDPIFDAAISQLLSVFNLKKFIPHAETEISALLTVCYHLAPFHEVNQTFFNEEMLKDQLDPFEVIVRHLGMERRAVKLVSNWWHDNHGPLIAFTKNDHRPIGLTYHKQGCYHYFDPTDGVVVQLDSVLAENLETQAWCLYRTFPKKSLTMKDLLYFSQIGNRKKWYQIVGLTFFAGILSLMIPYGFGCLLTLLFSVESYSPFSWLLVLLIASVLANTSCQLVRGFSILKMQGLTDNLLQTALWERLIKLPSAFFKEYSVGDLGSRAMGINQIRMAFTGMNLISLLDGTLSLFFLAFIFFYDQIVAWLAVFLLGLCFAITFVAGYIMLKFIRKETQLTGEVLGKTLEYLSGVAKLKSSCSESFAFKNWTKAYAAQQKNMLVSRFFLCAVETFNATLPYVAYFLLFFLFSRHAMTNKTDAPSVFLALNAAFGVMIGLAINLSQTLLNLINVIPICERLSPILKTLPEIDEKKAQPGSLSGQIELNSIYFRYSDSSPLVLENVSFEIMAGEYIAIVGESGGGKSSLLRLLLGFEQPRSGSILYDNKNLADFDMVAVRRQIGVVLQNSQLIMDSIYNNVTGGLPYTIDEVFAALKLVGIDDTIKNLPMGIHTYISEEGSMFSGGEKQLLLIARALIVNPRMIFLMKQRVRLIIKRKQK